MVASPYAVPTGFDFHLSLGELSPVNDQAMVHPGTSASTVADFDLEIEEQAFYRQDEDRVWCSLGAWDM
ncbi:MAG: hypothetical protein ACR2FY_16040 [Pirellulaceae bacterium]